MHNFDWSFESGGNCGSTSGSEDNYTSKASAIYGKRSSLNLNLLNQRNNWKFEIRDEIETVNCVSNITKCLVKIKSLYVFGTVLDKDEELNK